MKDNGRHIFPVIIIETDRNGQKHTTKLERNGQNGKIEKYWLK